MISPALLAPLNLIAALAMTCVFTLVLLADAAERDDKHFEALVDDAHEALGDRLAHYELALRGARGLFDGSEAVTRDEFHRWWQGRDELRDLAGALGIGFIRRVPPAEQGTYVAAMRAAGPDTFAIDPPTDREAWVVELIEPAAANANALGFDIASDPTRRAAARSALERGTAVLSEPLVLRSAPRADLGYNLFMPVARHAGALSAQEPTATSGWMYMPILVRRALQDLAPPRGELDFELYDDAVGPAPIYDLAPSTASDAPRQQRRTVALGGRSWTVLFATTPGFEVTSRLPIYLVAIGGCALALIVFVLVRVLSSARARAEARAAAMTIDLREKSAALERLALMDPLTGLPNRRLFYDRLHQAMLAHRRHPIRRFALLFIDLDGFKQVNDVHGHAVGDALLMEIARRLRAAVRASDSVTRDVDGNTTARIGGDEFVVLLQDMSRDDDAMIVASRLLAVLREPLTIAGAPIVPGASIGIVRAADAYEDVEHLLRDADYAMYRAKAAGRGRYVVLELGGSAFAAPKR